MADSTSANIVAIFAILLVVAIGLVVMWQMGVFGGRGDDVVDGDRESSSLYEPQPPTIVV